MKKITTREMVLSGLMIAIAVILSMPLFKIMGSIGLDAMPAFFSAATISPMMGGFVGAIAHMISAAFTGFPFSLPVHLAVALVMFLTCFLYGYTRAKFNRYLAVIVGIVMNGPVNLFVAAMLSKALGMEFAGMMMFTILIGPLTLAASVNVIVAEVLTSLIGDRVLASE